MALCVLDFMSEQLPNADCPLQKPLTMYFLRRARVLCIEPHPHKSLSPVFWDAEGLAEGTFGSFEGLVGGVDHPLGSFVPLSP